MLWRNLDSGVLYQEIRSSDDVIFIATQFLQCTATQTLSDLEEIKQEVKSGRWAAKYPVSDVNLQKALDGIETCCRGMNVHWITLSSQDAKTIVKMEFNSCIRDSGALWDLIERLRCQYPETNYKHFRSQKLNRYEMDNSNDARELVADVQRVIEDDDMFAAMVKEMEDLVTGGSSLLINLADFNRLLYGSDYSERAAYAWTAAKKVTTVSLVPAGFQTDILETKIVGTRNGYLLFKRSSRTLHILLLLSAIALAMTDWIILAVLMGIVLFLWTRLFARTCALTAADALHHYENEADFINDVYNSGMASFTFRDDNACALKKPNGMGWYDITEPVPVGALKRMGVRTFWRYDGSISVLVGGVKRVAYKVATDIWHVGSDIDVHGGPEVHLMAGSIGAAGYRPIRRRREYGNHCFTPEYRLANREKQ